MAYYIILILIGLGLCAGGCGVKGNPVAPDYPLYIFSGDTPKEFKRKKQLQLEKSKKKIREEASLKENIKKN